MSASVHMPQHTCRGQGIICENLFSFSIVRSGTPTQIIRSVRALLPTELYR